MILYITGIDPEAHFSSCCPICRQRRPYIALNWNASCGVMDLFHTLKWIMVIMMSTLYFLWILQFLSPSFYERYKRFY